MDHSGAWIHRGGVGRSETVGDDCVAVAVRSGSRFDPEVMFEDLFLGFRLDGRSPFEGVSPVCGGEVCVLEADPANALRTLAPVVAGMFDDSAAMELTGGVDSRLVLALAMAGGRVPAKCFTIGDAQDADVVVARQLAELVGAEHRVIPRPEPYDDLFEQGEAFVRASGYVCNFAAYAWLPSVFDRLAGWRTAQVSGVGGEIAEGFYYTGADRLFERLGSVSLWLRLRAAVDFGRWGSLVRPHVARKLKADLVERLGLLFSGRSWRASTDAFYRQHRIVGWALPVARASSVWYEPRCPLLSPEYLAWAASLSEEGRTGRRAQRAMIERLAPSLCEVPFASQLGAMKRGPITRRTAKAVRIGSRLIRRGGTAPTGASRIVSVALSAPGVREGLESFVRRHGGVLDESRWLRLLEMGSEAPPHPIGVVMTAWIAERALQNAYSVE